MAEVTAQASSESVSEPTVSALRQKPPLNLRRKTYNGRSRRQTDTDIAGSVAVLKLDLLLDKLARRLHEYEQLDLKFEGKVKTAYDILRTIFTESVCRVGEEAKGRAEMVVRILENQCSAVLSAKDASSDKVHGAVRFLEARLLDVEHAYYNKIATTRQSVLEKITNLQDEISKGTKEASIRVRRIQVAVSEGATRLLTFDELPWEWQNNPYIIRGYRFYESPLQCAASVLQIHNETGNIWTHILGFIFLCSVGLWFYPQTPVFLERMTNWDRAIFFVFLIAALKCLFCSALWHTFAHIANLTAMKKMACMDYVGISVLIAASIMTMEYHGFYCSPNAQIGYVGFTSFLGLLGIIIPWYDWFDRVENRLYRIMFFMGIAVSGIVPITHVMLTQTFLRTWLFYEPVLKSLLCYLVGVAVYASNYPEKWSPGLFDHIANSHQIWHCMILGGIWYHFKAVLAFHSTSREFACAAII